MLFKPGEVNEQTFQEMPETYRKLLLRLFTIQADSEIGGPHIYAAKWLLGAPTADDQFTVARIASEEIDHYRKFAKILKDIGVDVSHLLFKAKDQRFLDAFRGSMPTWADFVAFSFLIDRVGRYQLEEMLDSSYAPVNRVLPKIIYEEKGHVAFGETKLREMCEDRRTFKEAQDAVNRWYPRGLDMFGLKDSGRSKLYVDYRIKKRTNAEAREQYMQEGTPLLLNLGLSVPKEDYYRRFI